MSQTQSVLDPITIRLDFPILDQRIYKDKPLIYFDNGASTQRPQSVIAAIRNSNEQSYANVHRGIHFLSEKSSELYEQARQKVAHFIGAEDEYEVIFTSGTTFGINLVAHSWGNAKIGAGDEILLSTMEHHSNIVPWQQLAQRKGAKIKWIDISDDGQLDMNQFANMLNERTKLVAICAVSNVLGTILNVPEIVRLSHDANAVVMLDAAQHVPHDESNVKNWDVDFLTFSGHKMLGPSGIGILYGKRTHLEAMSPFLGGGSMISTVSKNGFSVGELPAKFEAGTPPITQAIGLGAAVDYLSQFEMRQILNHEQNLAQRAIGALESIEGLRIIGPTTGLRAGIVSFVVDGLSPQDISIFLDRQGIAIRAGHHCAMPLHQHLKIGSSCRASFYLYNTEDEVDYFVENLKAVIQKLR